MNATAMLCCAISSVFLGEYSLKDIAKVEKQAITNRLTIQRWHVCISRTLENRQQSMAATLKPPISPAPSKNSQLTADIMLREPIETTKTTWYVDGERVRRDTKWPYKVKVPGVSDDFYVDFNVWGDEERYTYSTERFADGKGMQLLVESRDTAIKRSPDKKIPMIDIRVLGFLPSGLLSNVQSADIGELIGNSDRKSLSMVDESLNGIPCKKLCFVKLNAKKNPVKYTIWIAPTMGYSVIRNEAVKDYPGGQVVQYADLVVKEYRNTGIWFPISSVCEMLVGGKRSMYETLNIEVLSLNETLDPRYFTIADLGVPPGTYVKKVPGPEDVDLVWDGKVVRQMTGGELLGEAVKPVGWSSEQQTLIITSLLLATTSGLFLWRRFYRARHAA